MLAVEGYLTRSDAYKYGDGRIQHEHPYVSFNEYPETSAISYKFHVNLRNIAHKSCFKENVGLGGADVNEKVTVKSNLVELRTTKLVGFAIRIKLVIE